MTVPPRLPEQPPRAPHVLVETDDFDLWWGQMGPYRNNTYLVIDRATGSSALIDPFFECADQWRAVLSNLPRPLDTILLTHTHIDHVGGIAALLTEYPDARVYGHEDGTPLITAAEVAALTGGIDSLTEYAEHFGLPLYEPTEITDYIGEGEPFVVGETRFEVLNTPGHCPGHVAFLNGKVLISGDVLYKGSVGFTAIPRSDPDVLAASILEKLLPLDDDVVVYTGHGETTTIGAERRTNEFVLEAIRARD